MFTRSRRGVLVAVLLLLAALPLLLAATHGSKRLTVLGCGDTITTSTTLAADIGPCGGTGVTIDADHVTLNLNGHQISGSAAGNGVFSNHASVTVQNGRIKGFLDGVHLLGTGSRVTNMRVGGAGSGIVVQGQNALVSGNRVFGNSGTGINGTVSGSQYTNNIVEGNTIGLDLHSAASISGNKVLSNASSGIEFTADQAVAVTNNIANGNKNEGIEETGGIDPTLATFSGNKAYFNTSNGIDALPGANDGGNNKADENGASTQCSNIVCS